MSITSGGMGRSIGEAFAEHGFGGGFDNVHQAGFMPSTKPGLVHQMVNTAFKNRNWANRVVPNVPRQIPLTPDNVYRPHYMEPPQIDRNMKDRPFPDQWRDPTEQPGGRMTSPMERYNIQEMQKAQNATYRGSDHSGNERDRVFPARLMPAVQRVGHNAVNRLIAGQKLTKNQQHMVGSSLLQMTNDQRRTFSDSLALAKFPGQNVNKVKAVFTKPLGQAMAAARVAKQRSNPKHPNYRPR